MTRSAQGWPNVNGLLAGEKTQTLSPLLECGIEGVFVAYFLDFDLL